MAEIIRYRPGTLADLEECLPICRDAFAYDEPLRESLLEWWSERLRSGSGFMPVIENRAAPPGRRIMFFGFLVFITDEFAEYLESDAPPFVMPNVLRQPSRLKSSFLTLDQIREGNAKRSLNILCTNSGTPVLSDQAPDYGDLIAKIVQFTYYSVGGYGLKSALIEMYGDVQWTYAEGFGHQLRTDYAAYYRAHREHTPRCADEAPRLYGSTAQEVATQFGSGVSQYFEYRLPRYSFDALEQEQLLYALTFDTDEELAQQLHLSVAGVRKRWQTIYEEVDRIDSARAPLSDASLTDMRHSQKKRLILSYVRQHMGELRPLPVDRLRN